MRGTSPTWDEVHHGEALGQRFMHVLLCVKSIALVAARYVLAENHQLPVSEALSLFLGERIGLLEELFPVGIDHVLKVLSLARP